MEKIPAEFLEDAIHNLSEILNELRQTVAAGQIPPPHSFLQKLFRALHTIKGSAQTFGLNTEGEIAHETESLLKTLQEGRVSWSGETKILLRTSLEILVNNFNQISKGKSTVLPVEFLRKLRAVSGKTSDNDKDLPLPENFPAEFLDELRASEIQPLCSAWAAGQEILILEFGIDQEGFAAKFKQVRGKLESAAEVIAVAPGAGQSIENKAIFRFLIASENTGLLIAPVREFSGKVLFQRDKNEGAGITRSNKDVENEISEAIRHGKKAAEILGKNVKFLAVGDDPQIPVRLSKTVSTVLLHLVRNAVAHGIEFPLERACLEKPASGTVEINAMVVNDRLNIKVCDDGRGIEDESKIFSAGYSAAPFVTGLSGRGVGLDAVQDAVHKARGSVKVKSKPGHGAKFTVDLPLD